MESVIIKSYRELIVWQKSINLVIDIYRVTNLFPNHEKFGLISQIRRSAISVPSNIAEGYARHSTKEFIRFLEIAIGSLAEMQTQLQISLRLDYLTTEPFETIFNKSREIERMLSSLIRKLKGKLN